MIDLMPTKLDIDHLEANFTKAGRSKPCKKHTKWDITCMDCRGWRAIKKW